MQRMPGPATVFSGGSQGPFLARNTACLCGGASPICINLYKMAGAHAVTLVSGLWLFWVADTKSIAGQFPTPTSRTLG